MRTLATSSWSHGRLGRSLLIASAVLNALLVWRIVDLGVTLSYARETVADLERQRGDAEAVLGILRPNWSHAELLQHMGATGLRVIEKPDEGAVYVGDVKFTIADGRVVAIDLR